MNRTIRMAIATTLVLGMAGCSKDDPEPKESAATTTSAAAEPSSPSTPTAATGPHITLRMAATGDTVTYHLFEIDSWDSLSKDGVILNSSFGTIDPDGTPVDVAVSSSLGAGVGDFQRAAASVDQSERKKGLRQRQPDRTAADGSPVYLFAGSHDGQRTYEIGGYIGDRDYSIGVEFTGPIDPAEADALVDSLIATIGPA